MKIIRENIRFNRGLSSEEVLNIGEYRKILNPTVDDIMDLESGDYLAESMYPPKYSIITIESSHSEHHEGIYFLMYQHPWFNLKSDVYDDPGVYKHLDSDADIHKHQDSDIIDNNEDIKDHIRDYKIISLQKMKTK